MNFSHGMYSGAVPVRRRFGNWAFLLLRSAQGWQFISGARGDDEALPEAARRQAWEVAAIPVLRFYWGHHHFTLEGDDGAEVQYIIGESASGELVLADTWLEHRWVSASLAAEILPEAMSPLVHWADAILTGADGTPGVKR